MFAERTTTRRTAPDACLILSRVIHQTSDNNIWDRPADFVDFAAPIHSSGHVTSADSSCSAVPPPFHKLDFHSTHREIKGDNPRVLPSLCLAAFEPDMV
jgi:hypothetical protein